MYYRTRTYLAGDWDGDKNLIQQIMDWNKNGNLALEFTDAHELKQARDGSLNCTIKNSLADRLNGSKLFVLIVGEKIHRIHADKTNPHQQQGTTNQGRSAEIGRFAPKNIQ